MEQAIVLPKRIVRCIRGLRESKIGVVVNETLKWHVSHVLTLDGVSDTNRRRSGTDRTSRRYHEMEMENPTMEVDGKSLDQLFETVLGLSLACAGK